VGRNGDNQWHWDGNGNENKAKPGSGNENWNEPLGMAGNAIKSHSRSSLPWTRALGTRVDGPCSRVVWTGAREHGRRILVVCVYPKASAVA